MPGCGFDGRGLAPLAVGVPVLVEKDSTGASKRFERYELKAGHDWILLLRGCPAYQRVAGFLQVLARRAQPQPVQQNGAVPVRLNLPLSRDEIAGFLGITRETISRACLRKGNSDILEPRAEEH